MRQPGRWLGRGDEQAGSSWGSRTSLGAQAAVKAALQQGQHASRWRAQRSAAVSVSGCVASPRPLYPQAEVSE